MIIDLNPNEKPVKTPGQIEEERELRCWKKFAKTWFLKYVSKIERWKESED